MVVADLVHAMKSWLREPLLHFVLLGGLLFLGYAYVSEEPLTPGDEIVVDTDRVQSLRSQFAATWQRDPTDAEFNGLVQGYIREERFFREGMALGLERDDPVIRRRLQQKLQFIAESVSDTEPTTEQLREYFAAHAPMFESGPRHAFVQVFVADSTREGAAMARAEALLVQLRKAAGADAYLGIGDSTLLPRKVELVSESAVARTFGDQFARDIASTPVGSWRGPIASAYGLHLVFVTDRAAKGSASFDDLRADVRREWMRDQQRQALDRYAASLQERYPVRIVSMVSAEAAFVP